MTSEQETQALAAQVRAIINEHAEYMDGYDRGQVNFGRDAVVRMIEAALRTPSPASVHPKPRTLRRTMMDTPIAVTIPDAVRLSGCSRSGLYEALKRGDLTARKAGRRTLINYADLEAYLASLPAYGAEA